MDLVALRSAGPPWPAGGIIRCARHTTTDGWMLVPLRTQGCNNSHECGGMPTIPNTPARRATAGPRYEGIARRSMDPGRAPSRDPDVDSGPWSRSVARARRGPLEGLSGALAIPPLTAGCLCLSERRGATIRTRAVVCPPFPILRPGGPRRARATDGSREGAQPGGCLPVISQMQRGSRWTRWSPSIHGRSADSTWRHCGWPLSRRRVPCRR